jgi:hypothetical protein
MLTNVRAAACLTLLPMLPVMIALAGCSSPSSNGAGADASTETPDGSVADSASDDSSTVDAMVDASTADVFEAGPHQPFLQVPNQGGPRLQHPAVVTVTYSGDTRNTQFEAYAEWIVGSNWLTTVGQDYGIGSGTVAGKVQLTTSAPTTMQTSGDIETFLATGIMNGTIPQPTGGLADALYMLYIPNTVHVTTTFAGGILAQSCTDWDAYHGEAHALGLNFSYAVMADCGVTDPVLTPIQMIEMAASHEFIEASTDAFPITQPAYQLVADPTSAWYSFYQFEVEVGDLCEIPAIPASENGNYAQRIWSNTSAAAGGDPCIPTDPSVPYFNTSATPNSTVHAAPGSTVQFQLQGWSLAPVSNWSLATDVEGTLSVTTPLSTIAMNNGGTATLSVEVPANADAGTSARIILWSEHSESDYHSWELDVTTP